MTPTRFRSGGTGASIRFAVGECSLGLILVAATENGICAILLGDDPDVLVRDLQDRFSHAQLIGGDKDFERLVDLPLDVRGTAFQRRVRQARCAKFQPVPRKAPRTLPGASVRRTRCEGCASVCINSIAVAIPCYRVVRNDYRWGEERKRALLDCEAATNRRLRPASQ